MFIVLVSVSIPPNLLHMRFLKDEFAQKHDHSNTVKLPDVSPRSSSDDVPPDVTRDAGEVGKDENVFEGKMDGFPPSIAGVIKIILLCICLLLKHHNSYV